MSTIQHLLEKQRKEVAEKICHLTEFGGHLHPNDILPDLSTIQQEIVSEILKKIEQNKMQGSQMKLDAGLPQGLTRRELDYNLALSDLSSWLEGEKKN